MGREPPDRPPALGEKTRLRGGPVWEMLEFILNGFVFILIGLELPEILVNLAKDKIPLPQIIGYAALMTVAIILIRILWVFPASYLPRLLSRSLRRRDAVDEGGGSEGPGLPGAGPSLPGGTGDRVIIPEPPHAEPPHVRPMLRSGEVMAAMLVPTISRP